MQLVQELQDLIIASLTGERPLADIWDWLHNHVQDIADLDLPLLTDLSDQAWIAIWGWQDHICTSTEARESLAALVATRHAETVGTDGPAPARLPIVLLSGSVTERHSPEPMPVGG